MIATAGKAYADVLAALRMLGIDDATAKQAGIGVYKIALIYPLDPVSFLEAAGHAEEILFVEEKKANTELQAKQILYNHPIRPHVTGKTTPDGLPLLPEDTVLNSTTVALALAERLLAALPGLASNFPRAIETFETRLRRHRVGPGESDVVLACDLIAAVHPEVSSTVRRNYTLIVANTDIMATADFQVKRDLAIPLDRLLERLTDLAGVSPRHLAATHIAETLLGDSIAANMIMLGYAWQCGRIPLTLQAWSKLSSSMAARSRIAPRPDEA